MRIYSNAYELMSEMGRNLWEMGLENKPKTYQNKVIEGNDDFITKEITCEQYCLLKLPDPDTLFIYTNSRDWAESEFNERVNPNRIRINPGEAWKLRKEIWEEFINKFGKFDYSYSDRMNEKFYVESEDKNMSSLDIVIELLKRDPDTRKAILPIYDVQDTCNLYGKARIPCSMYYNFLIRNNAKGEKQLNICYHQRSSDFITHFGNDVYLAWKLMQYVASVINVKEGNLFHTIDSLHCYKKDWVTLKTSLSQKL